MYIKTIQTQEITQVFSPFKNFAVKKQYVKKYHACLS